MRARANKTHAGAKAHKSVPSNLSHPRLSADFDVGSPGLARPRFSIQGSHGATDRWNRLQPWG